MLDLEGAQPPEPGVGEGEGGGDGQQRLILARRERRLDAVERLGQLGQQAEAKEVSRARPFSRTNRAAPSRSSNNLT